MKNQILRLLVLPLLLALPAVVQAQFTYSVANHAVTITGYTGSGGAVFVPDLIATYPVVSIQAHAFDSQGSITSIRLPDTVTNIGDQAFYYCDALTNAALGTGVINIGYQAFYQCAGLTNFTLPGNVRSLGESSFAQCQSLSSITIPDTVTNLGDYAFNNCVALTNATIGNGVIRIGANAFSWCGSLTNLLIGNGVTSIGDNAFAECLSLPSLSIPNNVTNIEFSAFSDCSSLTNVVVGNSLAHLGQNAFEYCTGLIAMYFQGNEPLVDDNIFLNDTLLTVYYMAEATGWSSPFGGRPAVQWNPFTYTVSNSQVTITGYNGPGGAIVIPSKIATLPVTSIGYSAFRGLTNLTSILIPTSVTNIDNYAFMGCLGLTTLAIPNSVIGIGASVFDNCSHLTAITVGDLNPVYSSVDGVLFDKTQGTLLRFPGGKGGNYAVPNHVTSIAVGAFAYCNGLNSVNVPDSVNEVGNGAFILCNGLNSVTLGSGVAALQDYAFALSTNLTAVYFKGTPPFYYPGSDLNIFTNDFKVILYYLPAQASSWVGFGGLYANRPITVWNPEIQPGWRSSFGVRTNQFGFSISSSSRPVVVVEACTNLANPNWVPVSTNSLTNFSTYVSDPQWTNYPGRFYRLRSP